MAATLLAGTADAAEVNYQVELVLLHSNNLNLSEDNQVSETVLVPRLSFDVAEEGSAVRLQARGLLERRHYLGNKFSDENRGEFAGQLVWALLPRRLNLVFEDYLSLEPIRIRDGRYPGNLQQVNVFLLGPTFYARMGDATQFQLDVRAADSYAEVTQSFNGKRYTAAAALKRDFSPASSGSIHAVSTRAEFDDPTLAPDYTRNDAFVRYQHALPRGGSYEVDLGQSRLNRSSGGDVSDTLARVTAQWQISPRSRVRLRGRYQFGDALQDLVSRPSDPDDMDIAELGAFSFLVTPGVYRQRMVDLEYRFDGERIDFRIRPLRQRLRYLDGVGDRDEKAVYLQASYQLRPRMELSLQTFLRKRDFLDRPRNDIDRTYDLGLEYQLSRHWSWRAEAIRNSKASNELDPRYKENAVRFTVIWAR